MTSYKVYYNEHCMKYGIQKLVNDYRGEHWKQILVYKGQEVAPYTSKAKLAHCYTEYRGVAYRWLREIMEAQK